MDLSGGVTFAPNWFFVILCGLICLGILVGSQRGTGRLFTPLRMFLLANVGGLGIAFLGLDKRMTPWSVDTWIVWIVGVAAYTLGAGFAHMIQMGAGAPSAVRDDGLERRLFLLTLVPFCLSLLGGVHAVGTFPVFAAEPEEARKLFIFHSFWAGWALAFSMLAFPFGARVIALGGRRVWIYHVLFWGVIVGQMLSGIRGVALFGFFCLASQWEMLRGRIPLLKIALGVLLFLGMFVAVAVLRLGDMVQFTGRIPASTIAWVLASPPYVYIANCYWNLDYGVRDVLQGTGHPSTWGFSVTRGFWDVVGVGEPIGKSLGFETVFHERSAKVISLNTFSFTWPLYKDGGIPFVALFSLAWGFAATMLHRAAMRGAAAGTQLVSSYISFASLFSFFALYFVVGTYLVFLVLLLLLAILMARVRSSRAEAAAQDPGGQPQRASVGESA